MPIPSRQSRYHALDGLRGLFAVMVVALHFFGSAYGWKNFPFANGYLAVDFFFMLSGFVLCHVYESGLRSQTILTVRFISHRLVRMYPLHIATMIVAGCIDYLYWNKLPYADGASWSAIVNVLLLQTTGLTTSWSWNAASWSISGEFWVGVLILPFVFQRVRTEFVVLAAMAGYYFLFQSIPTLHEHPYRVLSGNLSVGIIRSFSGIMMGVAIYRISCTLKSTSADPSRFSAIAGFFEVISLGSIIYIMHSNLRGHVEFATLFAMPFLIYSVANSHSVVARLLSSAPMRWLGSVSYSIYLIHFPMITLGVYIGMMKIENPYIRFSIFAPVVLVTATLVYRLFERPIYMKFRDMLLPSPRYSRVDSSSKASI
ncbi:acyltransferase family protein [Burkholderia sp. AU32262]|uniref:acyltransferase family protein n=1 Tax=Burkholderia sp. AU32262 TaxID=2879630 RepID=UPI001CF3CFCD|nr:acyltransferase [Burkholderia sp. AU32262]MCA8242817.1 acyltransferase [Burkholderia sp. AU32262]